MKDSNGFEPPDGSDKYDQLLDELAESTAFESQNIPSTFEEYLKQRDPAGLFPERAEEYRAEYERLASSVVLTDGKVEVEGLNFDGDVEPLPDLSEYALLRDEYLGEVSEQAIPDALSHLPEEIRADLMLYENPEDLLVSKESRTFRMHIVNPILEGSPRIISIQVDSKNLFEMFSESFLDMLWRAKDENEQISKDELWNEMWADEGTPRALNYAFCFFNRIFPHMMLKAFNLALRAAELPVVRPYVENADVREEVTHRQIDAALADIKTFLKERIRVRSKGRPAGGYEGLAGEVWKTGA